jgi:hypothetical protein
VERFRHTWHAHGVESTSIPSEESARPMRAVKASFRGHEPLSQHGPGAMY